MGGVTHFTADMARAEQEIPDPLPRERAERFGPVSAPGALPGGALRDHLRRLEQHEKQQERAHGPLWATVGLPVICFVIALGALYWSATLRDQTILQQSSIAALTRQNQKLSQELDAATAGQDLPTPSNTTASQAAAPTASHTDATQGGNGAHATAAPPPQAPPAKPTRSGVSNPPPLPQAARHASGAPPATGRGAAEGRTPRREPAPAGDTSAPASSLAYGNAPGQVATQPVYSDPLAENIAAVFQLQKHSPTRLSEFHLTQGGVSQPFPGMALEVRNPDKKLGSYTLLVRSGASPYETKGQVNVPLNLGPAPNGKEYQLTVLNIVDHAIYGYISTH
jgi:hypothetical protein